MLTRTTRYPLLIALSLGLVATGCGKVKQKQPPRIPDDAASSSDLDDPDAEGSPVPVENPEPEIDRRAQCCQQCVDKLGENTSGDPPGAIPCKSLSVEPGCIVWFDGHPMNGKEAQACVSESDGG